MAVDRDFGSSGAIWSGVQTARRDWFGAITGTVLLGGTAVGLTVGPQGPTVVVEGLRPGAVDQTTRVVAIRFPADGHPAESGRWDGALPYEVSTGTWSSALATCLAPTGDTAVLRRELQPTQFALPGAQYGIRSVSFGATSAGVSGDIAVPSTALLDVQTASHRMVADGTGFLVVSAADDRIRLATVPRQGAPNVSTDIRPGGAGTALPGLTRIQLASVRADGGWVVIAFTAFLDHPGVGPVSVGAVARVSPAGARDAAFGDNGLWVSPLTNQYRQFVCAGEFPGGVVGIQGSEAIAFGIAPGGAGLDDPFALSGELRRSLGGPLVSPVTADDGIATFLFARRQDGRVVGCRFDRQGTVDEAFGTAGLVVITSDGAPATPCVALAGGGKLTIAVTRQVQGWDCDRVPGLTVLSTTNGAPDSTFGAGGFALHSSVGYLAAVAPDGSSHYTERRVDLTAWPGHRAVGDPTLLRRADAAGRFERVVPFAPSGVANWYITSLRALDDGSLLVGGHGDPAWVAKLSPGGSLDPAFGTNGVAVPRPGVRGTIRVLGVRPDGRIAIQFEPWLSSAADPLAVGVLRSDGGLDTTYASAGQGFIGLSGLVVLPTATMPDPVASTVRTMLDTDGSIVCALATGHQWESDPYVRFALRRIDPTGVVDAAFGVGVPSLAPPAAGRRITFTQPPGSTSERSAYSHVTAVGCAWMGGKLYVVAAGTAGGILFRADTSPAYGLLVVTRWNADGSVDSTFGANGVQEVGFSPDRLDYTPVGVLPRSSTELLVYGSAGRAQTQTTTVGTTTSTSTSVRRPEPALFRVRDPGGVDTAFGAGGAELLPTQEFQAAIVAARLLPPANRLRNDRVRFVCTDKTTQPLEPKDPTSTFGGIGQFLLPRPRLTRF